MVRSLALAGLVLVLADLSAGAPQPASFQNLPVETSANLSAPIVREPLYECAEMVFVSGFAPKARVRVYANGIEVALAEPHLGFAEFKLSRPLAIGDSVSATQTVDGVESFHSAAAVAVLPLPDFENGIPPAPKIAHALYECARIVTVDDVVPGATVVVTENGLEVGRRQATDWWVAVGTSALSVGSSVQATQILCDTTPGANPVSSPASQPATVVTAPTPFASPTLDQASLVVGNDTVTLHGLYVGALVRVLNGALSMGGGLATWTSNWVPLTAPIEASWSVVGEQELCGTQSSSKPMTPTKELPKLEIAGPVCDTDTNVRVSGGIINATIALFRNGQLIGVAGAMPGDLVMTPGAALAPGDRLSAQQFLGSIQGPASEEEVVCACSPAFIQAKADEYLSDAQPEWLPIDCGTSSVPVLASAQRYDVFDLTLRADFDVINNEVSRFDAQSDGSVFYDNPVTGQPVEVSVRVEARGNTRFIYCGFRPLRLRFKSDPVGTVFEGTGTVIKLVTHCGYRGGIDQWLFTGTPEEHTRRTLQELALYEVIEALGSGSLNTRIARIRYEMPDGAHLTTQFGFIREREKRAAQRCGLEEREENEPVLPADPTSEFQAEFQHKFLFSRDYILPIGHNVVRMTSQAAQTQSYIPYDFDLSGVIQPTYQINNGWTIEDNGRELVGWLMAQSNPMLVRAQVVSLLLREPALRQVVEDCPLDERGKARLRAWLHDHLRRLKCFLN